MNSYSKYTFEVYIQINGELLLARPYQAEAYQDMVSDPSCEEKTFSFYDGSCQFTLKRLKDNMFLMITNDNREHLLSDSKTSFEVDY